MAPLLVHACTYNNHGKAVSFLPVVSFCQGLHGRFSMISASKTYVISIFKTSVWGEDLMKYKQDYHMSSSNSCFEYAGSQSCEQVKTITKT